MTDTPSDETIARIKQTIGRNLRAALARKGWTRADLRAAVYGKDGKMDLIDAYCDGELLPNSTTVDKLAAALGISREELLAGTPR